MGTQHVRAAVLVEPGRVEIQRFPMPTIGEDDALLRVEATGVCGTDWAAYTGTVRPEQIPYVLGHEVVGRIEAIGPVAAKRWGVAVGDQVVVEEYLPCGVCPDCLVGEYAMCTVGRIGGTSIRRTPSLWGGFSEFMYLSPQALVHQVEAEMAPELLQLFIPIANGIYWVDEVAGTRVGDTVVVLGPGPHGLGAVIGAREAGAGKVIVVGRSTDEYRLETALALGADDVLDADRVDVTARLADMTGCKMADVVINAAGAPATFSLALEVAGSRATVVQAGIVGQRIDDIPVDMIFQKKLTIKGVRGRPTRVVPHALALIASGRYPLEKMCTHRFGLDDTQKALQLIGRGEPGLGRIAIIIGE